MSNIIAWFLCLILLKNIQNVHHIGLGDALPVLYIVGFVAFVIDIVRLIHWSQEN